MVSGLRLYIVEVPVFTVSDFMKTEYRADVDNADHPAQAARLIDPVHVEKLRTMLCKSRGLSDLGVFSVAEKSPPADRGSVCPLVVDGSLTVPLYLIDGFQRRAMSKTVDDSGVD